MSYVESEDELDEYGGSDSRLTDGTGIVEYNGVPKVCVPVNVFSSEGRCRSGSRIVYSRH